MSTASQPEKFTFQTEVQQLLDIVIHSLYTNREIFIRELVSNASDSLEKLRHIQITEKEITDDRLPLEINITSDDTAGILTIQDFGVGMTRDELVQNLGTIAHSGSKAFLKSLGEEGRQNLSLIGKFGVGFYSVFMVAKRVRVFSRSWQPGASGYCWESEGTGHYKIEEVEGQRRGCKIVVELQDEHKEFAKEWRARQILDRYSRFVQFPIKLGGEQVNKVQAIWTRNKNDIKDEEYDEFYGFIADSQDKPRYRLHFNADAPLALNALMFVPQDNPEKLGFSRVDPGVALYCRKILIEPHPRELLPEWLRFLKGVVDSEDLPLNISRETMQDNALVHKLNRLITRRFLKFLEEEAKKSPERYEEFFRELGYFLKEGVAVDFSHREELAKLLRFESSLTEPGKLTNFADYVSRMKDGQKEIYYLVAPSREAIKTGPYLEGFRARNIEALFLYEAVDEFVMNHLREFDGRKLIAADSDNVKLDEIPPPPGEDALSEEETKRLCLWLRSVLGERVAEVSLSKRLVDSPALVLAAEPGISPIMRRMMKVADPEAAPKVRLNMEINPRHPLVRNLAGLRDKQEDLARLVAEQIFDNARVAAGLLDDPREMITRVNRLLEAVASRQSNG